MALLLLHQLTELVILDKLTPFVAVPVELGGLLVLCVSFVVSTRHISRSGGSGDWDRYLPIGLNVLTVALLLTVPFESIYLGINFSSKLDRREEVVREVMSGAIKEDVAGSRDLAQLPSEYGDLSAGNGQIVIFRDSGTVDVLFFTYRGILDNYSGFLYREDPAKPLPTVTGGRPRRVVRYSDRWFWVAD
jgi:hypothetical protein